MARARSAPARPVGRRRRNRGRAGSRWARRDRDRHVCDQERRSRRLRRMSPGRRRSGSHDDQSGRHRLQQRDAELLLDARAHVDATEVRPVRAGRTGRQRASGPPMSLGRCPASSRPAPARPASASGTADRCSSSCSRSSSGRMLEVAADDEQVAPVAQLGRRPRRRTSVAMPFTRCRRPTLTTSGRLRRSSGSAREQARRARRSAPSTDAALRVRHGIDRSPRGRSLGDDGVAPLRGAR